VSWILCADASSSAKIERLSTGEIKVRGRMSRTGIQEYAPWAGAKIQDRPIKILRTPEEVFSKDSLESYKSKPVTVDHPAEEVVTPDTWKKLAVGHVTEEEPQRVPFEDHEYVETAFVVSDGPTIKALEGKDLTEISQGYRMVLDWTPGVHPKFGAYDAQQTQIEQNHTALLGVLTGNRARAGAGARVLLDSTPSEKKTMKLAEMQALIKTLLVDAAPKVSARVTPVLKGLEPVCDSMTEEEVKKIVAAAVAETITQMKTEKPVEPAVDELTPEEEAAKKKAEEEANAKAATDRAEGVKAAQQALKDAQDATIAVVDARAEVAGMVPPGYDPKGKTVRQLHLDAIEACAPKLRKILNDSDSDEKVAGSFSALKASEAKWVQSVDAGPTKPTEHLAAYNKTMNDAFTSSFAKGGSN
jgi:hypothetical protein